VWLPLRRLARPPRRRDSSVCVSRTGASWWSRRSAAGCRPRQLSQADSW